MKSTYDYVMRYFEKRGLGNERHQLVSQAKGRVLEIGIGTGANLPFYVPSTVQELVLTDFELNPIVQNKLDALNFKIPYTLTASDVMTLPLADQSFDAVVCTLVFCSVKDVSIGLKEIKRVLKDDGKLLFIEHVSPEKKGLRMLFNTLTPLWKRVAGNCHLNRDYLEALTEEGFRYTLKNRFIKTAFISGIATIVSDNDLGK